MRNHNFRKECAPQNTKKRILIISEGKKTEPNYFNAIKRQFRLTSFDIADTKKNTGKELLQTAIKIRAKAIKDKNEYDEIWIVLDRDGYTKHPQVFDRAKKYTNIKIGFSSPCFEYWLLLHFEYTSAPFNDCDSTIKKLETYLQDYQKNKDYSKIFMERIEMAVLNSKKIKKLQEETSDVKIWAFNPYSNLHELVYELFNLGV